MKCSFAKKKAKLVAAQKDLIKSPLLYIIICITFLYSCPKIASYDVEVGNIKSNTQKEVLLRTPLPLQLRLQFTFVHTYIYTSKEKRKCVKIQLVNYHGTGFIDIVKSTLR